MIVAETNLWYIGGSSDKVYRATVTQESGIYNVTGKWGRRGKTMQSQIKGTFSNERDAMTAYHGLVAEKTNKGYQITGRTVEAA